MQISRDIVAIGVTPKNRRAFLMLMRLKMKFHHGWVNASYPDLAAFLKVSEATVRRRVKKLKSLGYVSVDPTGVLKLHNLNSKRRKLMEYQKILIKKKLYKPILSSVSLTPEMCDKEILAHLTNKLASNYCRKCDFLRKVKEDYELLGRNEPIRHFDSEDTVVRRINKLKPVSPIPNEKLVISDKKMADRLGVAVSDFRRNIKPYWRIFGALAWSASLVQLPMTAQQLKYGGELPKGVFIHKGHAYTHTTQYFNPSKL